MNTKGLLKLIFFTVAIKFIAVFIGLFTYRWLNVYIEKDSLRDFNIILSLCGVLYAIVNFGIPTLITKLYTNKSEFDNQANGWYTLFVLRIFSYFIGLLLLLVSLPLIGIADIFLGFWIFTLGFILIVDLSYRAVTDSIGNSWQFSSTDVIGKLFLLIGLVVIGYFKRPANLFEYVLISTVAYLITLVLDIIWQNKNITWGKFDKNFIMKNKNIISYLTISNILIASFALTDKLFLNGFGASSEEIVGYSNAYKLFELFAIIPGLSVPILSSFSKKRADNDKLGQFEVKVKNFLQINNNQKAILISFGFIACLIGVSIYTVSIILGPLILNIIDPMNKYPAEFTALPILMFGIIMLPLNQYLSSIMQLYDKTIHDTSTYLIQAICGLLLYTILIGKFGYVGAAISTTAIYFVELIVRLYFLSQWNKKGKTDAI
jgi:O-antigen/teichoic acid export membrane protein